MFKLFFPLSFSFSNCRWRKTIEVSTTSISLLINSRSRTAGWKQFIKIESFFFFFFPASPCSVICPIKVKPHNKGVHVANIRRAVHRKELDMEMRIHNTVHWVYFFFLMVPHLMNQLYLNVVKVTNSEGTCIWSRWDQFEAFFYFTHGKRIACQRCAAGKENIKQLITPCAYVWLHHKHAQFSCAGVGSALIGPLQSHTIFFSQKMFNSITIPERALWKNPDLFKYEQIFIWPAGALKLLSICSAGPWLFAYIHNFVMNGFQHNSFYSASQLLNLISVSRQREMATMPNDECRHPGKTSFLSRNTRIFFTNE